MADGRAEQTITLAGGRGGANLRCRLLTARSCPSGRPLAPALRPLASLFLKFGKSALGQQQSSTNECRAPAYARPGSVRTLAPRGNGPEDAARVDCAATRGHGSPVLLWSVCCYIRFPAPHLMDARASASYHPHKVCSGSLALIRTSLLQRQRSERITTGPPSAASPITETLPI